MKKQFSKEEFNSILSNLSTEFDIYAPISKPFKGIFSDTDLITYDRINSIEQIHLKEKSFYSAKEITLPMRQTIFYFTENGFTEPETNQKKILVFIRSCDLHAVHRVDQIYLNNKFSDKYYEEAKKKVKYVVMGCPGKGWDSCFCVSFGTNTSDNYNLGITFKDDYIFADIKDSELETYFTQGKTKDFDMEFVSENIEKVNIPENIDLENIITDEMWKDYDRCIKCGRCNFTCPTCTCFTTQDIFNRDNEKTGERRRVWASCHVDNFTTMAGGHEFRKQPGERMRFKVMHKISDFKKRFGVHMCVGCGRCEDACPEYISYINCINKLAKKVGENNE